jgi:hypothetical protein
MPRLRVHGRAAGTVALFFRTNVAGRDYRPLNSERQRENQWYTTDSAGLLRNDWDMFGKLSLGNMLSANQ